MYETLQDLVAAVRSGEVTAPLVLDHDLWTVHQDGKCVFSLLDADLTAQALDMLSVPHERA